MKSAPSRSMERTHDLTPVEFNKRIFTFSLMLGIGIALLGAVFNAQARHIWVNTPGMPWCSQNYRASSYALGLGTAFSMPWKSTSSHFFDNGCYSLGKNNGEAIRSQHSSDKQACESAFKIGMGKGLTLENPGFDSRYADCEQAGYSFGEALLSENARSAASTQTCNLAYKKGYTDGQEDRIPQAFSNTSEDFCYSLGFDDGTWFGR